jgi:membrane protein
VRVGKALGRPVQLGRRATVQAVIDFYNSDNLTYAASIAYYSLLSLFPFLLLVLSVLSRLTVGHTDETLLEIVATALPSRFDFLVTQVQELVHSPLTLSVTGVVGFLVALFASMGVFAAITSAVNYAWGVNGVKKEYGFLQHKLIAFVMLVAAGVLMMAALLIVSGVQVVETRWFAGVVSRFPALAALGGFVFRNIVTPLFIVVVGMVYYFVPNVKVRVGDVWFGALVAGLLWRLAFALFSWYVRDLSRFSVHGSLAAVVVFLLWVYMTAVILLYGAEVAAAYSRFSRHLPHEAPAAPPRD